MIPKKLIIYSYSFSTNFLRESFAKIGVKIVLTNNLEKASVIIGGTKLLKKNLRLKELAEKKNIPIYSLNRISIYQLTKLIKYINFVN